METPKDKEAAHIGRYDKRLILKIVQEVESGLPGNKSVSNSALLSVTSCRTSNEDSTYDSDSLLQTSTINLTISSSINGFNVLANKEFNNIEIEIFNALGEKVGILINQNLKSGNNFFNLFNLPLGMYIEKINTKTNSIYSNNIILSK